jgi:hypothetical protein
MCAAGPRSRRGGGDRRLQGRRSDPETDALYLAVRSYVTDNAGQRPARILAAIPPRCPSSPACWSARAPRRLRVLATGGRSADFGKSLVVPVVTDPDEAGRGSRRRIDHALWTEGQIALEFPPAAARDLQDRASGSARAIRPAGPGADRTPGRPSRAANASDPASPSSRARRTGPFSCGAPRKASARQTLPRLHLDDRE